MAAKKVLSAPKQLFTDWPKPDFALVVKTHKNFRRNYHDAMMYAHYELSNSDLKKEVVKYFKIKDMKHPWLEIIKDIHENKLVVIGKYIYILNHGADLPDDVSVKLMPTLEKIINEEKSNQSAEREKIKEKDPKVSSLGVMSIQDRLRARAEEIAGEMEGWLDDFFMNKKSDIKTVEDFVGLFKSNELKGPHMRHLQLIFQRRADEIEAVINGKDKELAEGYTNFSKPELKKYDMFFKNLFKAATMMQETAKVVRAPRKKKPISQEKIVSKLKYKKEDNTLGIVSQNPVQIIGAKELWVYNIKTRKLSQYKAIDASGLTVKGAGLLNYSTDSVEKTLRKPPEQLAEFKKASKVKLRTFLKDLSTLDTKCNGKLNENHVILRIDK
jgi:hypothetical protein